MEKGREGAWRVLAIFCSQPHSTLFRLREPPWVALSACYLEFEGLPCLGGLQGELPATMACLKPFLSFCSGSRKILAYLLLMKGDEGSQSYLPPPLCLQGSLMVLVVPSWMSLVCAQRPGG